MSWFYCPNRPRRKEPLATSAITQAPKTPSLRSSTLSPNSETVNLVLPRVSSQLNQLSTGPMFLDAVLCWALTGKRVSSVFVDACLTERGGYSGPPGEVMLYSADCSRIWDVVRRGSPAIRSCSRLSRSSSCGRSMGTWLAGLQRVKQSLAGYNGMDECTFQGQIGPAAGKVLGILQSLPSQSKSLLL